MRAQQTRQFADGIGQRVAAFVRARAGRRVDSVWRQVRPPRSGLGGLVTGPGRRWRGWVACLRRSGDTGGAVPQAHGSVPDLALRLSPPAGAPVSPTCRCADVVERSVDGSEGPTGAGDPLLRAYGHGVVHGRPSSCQYLLQGGEPDRDQRHRPRPSSHVRQCSSILREFNHLSQDSGNVSWLVESEGHRLFVKAAGTTQPPAPGAPVPYLDHPGRVSLLRNAINLARSCDHQALPALLNVIESPAGPALV